MLALCSTSGFPQSAQNTSPEKMFGSSIRSEKEKAEIVEKMYFDRLLDFVYVEFMKGLQKGFVPKR